MEQHFTTTLLTDRTPAEAFQTILDVRAWWSGLYGETFEGSSAQPGDEFSFLAGGGMHYSKQRMTELVPGKTVVWRVTESSLTFTGSPEEWTGTSIRFDLSEEDGKTKIVFTHVGLIPEFECYDSCAPAWTQYVQQQLKQALTR